MRGRPELITSYAADMAIFRSTTQRVWIGVLLVAALFAPFALPQDWTFLLTTAMVAAIGAIGLNLVTGYAGQVSLGHAFFIGLGAYTAAVLGGAVDDPKAIGLGLDMVIWLPAAGLVPALAGALVAPIAVRLRGLYLAFVTLGLVFIGEHVFRQAKDLTGGVGVGRRAAIPSLFGFRFDQDGAMFGIDMIKEQKLFFLALAALVVLGVLAKNLARSRVGRAFSAVRDRDIAAEVMGIGLTRSKFIAFTVSSFYAGIAGALLFTLNPVVQPTAFNLLMSIRYVAMVLIGGVASIAGSILGAGFLTLLPRVVGDASRVIPFIGEGGVFSAEQVATILFGLLIVVFLIFEPLGLIGIWRRVKNYWKAWPFSY